MMYVAVEHEIVCQCNSFYDCVALLACYLLLSLVVSCYLVALLVLPCWLIALLPYN
jgi:hypothetical protein